MTHSNASLYQPFYRDEVRAILACQGCSCGFDVCFLGDASPPEARLEVLLQPRSPAGLPQGLARRLYETDFELRPSPRLRRALGHVRLPFRLTPDLLRECHFRITRDMMDDRLASDPESAVGMN